MIRSGRDWALSLASLEGFIDPEDLRVVFDRGRSAPLARTIPAGATAPRDTLRR